jgi:lactoylglutathione lyase
MGLQYTSIRVMDMEKSVEFYTQEMGLKEIGRQSFVPGEQIVNLLDEETGQRINLMHYSEDCKLYTPYKLDGVELDHLMFEVKDAKKAFRELVKKGAPIAMDLWERETPDGGKVAMGMVKDPNGIWIGLRSKTNGKKPSSR